LRRNHDFQETVYERSRFSQDKCPAAGTSILANLI
jgi:hypothetical protein